MRVTPSIAHPNSGYSILRTVRVVVEGATRGSGVIRVERTADHRVLDQVVRGSHARGMNDNAFF